MMNYITEMNAFYQRQETNPLSAHATCLWYALMHINNRTNWKKTFTVSVSVLMLKANLTASSFKRARRELHEKDYIRYQSRGGNQAAMYEMITMEEYMKREVSQDEVSIKEVPTHDIRTNTSHHLDHNVSPLVKQDENKQTTTTDAIHFFEKNGGQPNPMIMSEIKEWANIMGEALVTEAIRRSIDRGKINWGYIKAILKSWQQKGYRTVVETEQEAIDYSAKQNKKQGWTGQRQSAEIVPEWFKKLKMDAAKEAEKKKSLPAIDPLQAEEEEKELKRLIAAYHSG